MTDGTDKLRVVDASAFRQEGKDVVTLDLAESTAYRKGAAAASCMAAWVDWMRPRQPAEAWVWASAFAAAAVASTCGVRGRVASEDLY